MSVRACYPAWSSAHSKSPNGNLHLCLYLYPNRSIFISMSVSVSSSICFSGAGCRKLVRPLQNRPAMVLRPNARRQKAEAWKSDDACWVSFFRIGLGIGGW